jgi:hypothetical protein
MNAIYMHHWGPSRSIAANLVFRIMQSVPHLVVGLSQNGGEGVEGLVRRVRGRNLRFFSRTNAFVATGQWENWRRYATIALLVEGSGYEPRFSK